MITTSAIPATSNWSSGSLNRARNSSPNCRANISTRTSASRASPCASPKTRSTSSGSWPCAGARTGCSIPPTGRTPPSTRSTGCSTARSRRKGARKSSAITPGAGSGGCRKWRIPSPACGGGSGRGLSQLAPSLPQPPPHPSPASGLGHLHMFEGPSCSESLEARQAIVEGNRSWRFMGGVSAPSAELGDSPCGPGESFFAMRIFLKLGLALQVFVDRVEHFDFFGRESKACWKHLATIAGLNELDDDGCRFGGDGHQLHKPIGGFKLAVLDLQALGFHRTEELLDDPALLVPGDDLPGIGDAADWMGGQQEPMDGLCALGRMLLDDLHEVERHACGQISFSAVCRPLQNDGSEAQGKMGLARTTVHACGHVNHRLGGKRHPLDLLAKRSALDQRMVVHDPGQKVDMGFRRARPMGIDVPLPIIDHGDHAGRRQNVLGLRRRRHPARRLLVRQGAPCMRNFDVALARPHLAAGKPKTSARNRINCHHRVQEHAKNIAFPDLSQLAPVVCSRRKLDVAGILDRQDVTVTNRNPRLLAPAFNPFFNRHPSIGHETPEAHLLTPHTACDPAQTNAARTKHATEKRRPPLSRRRSPKRPSDQFSAVCIGDPPAESTRPANHPARQEGIASSLTESTCRAKMCRCPSLAGEGWGGGTRRTPSLRPPPPPTPPRKGEGSTPRLGLERNCRMLPRHLKPTRLQNSPRSSKHSRRSANPSCRRSWPAGSMRWTRPGVGRCSS